MKSKYSVSDTEWEVLKLLWKHGEAVRQSELLVLAEQEGKKGWKRQTLNTFLSRLEEKGLVRRERGRAMPVYSEEEYRALLMRESIDNLYGGKFSNMLASFMDQKVLSKDEITELRQMLDQ